MSNSPTIIEEIIKTAPGFIGERARNYALLFKRSLPKGTEETTAFNKAFFIAIIQRDTLTDITRKQEGSLLHPLYDKGIDEIHRVCDKVGISQEAKYRLDLPTMVLYSMLLESESLRIIFDKADEQFYQFALKGIYQEVRRICPSQIRVEEQEYIKLHTTLLKPFLSMNRSVGQNDMNEGIKSIIAKMFKGGKQVDLEGSTDDK